MPADITGTEILQDLPGERRMVFVKGPIHANVILADEINRTPPKTQAALLEAMQEHQVTAAGTAPPARAVLCAGHAKPDRNGGNLPAPRGQLDRFMFNVTVDYLSEDDEVTVVSRTTAAAPPPLSPCFTPRTC